MGFVKSLEEIMANFRASADFYDARMLTVFWETRPEIVQRLLPPPLKPAAAPIAVAFVASYPSTNFDVTYNESALFLQAEYDGERGNYCLSMPVTSDMAMAGGREVFGFPKKMAEIRFQKEGDTVGGWTERRGVRFMEIRARLTGQFSSDEALNLINAQDIGPDGSFKAIAYNFKHFPAPEGGGNLDYHPRLVRQETVFKPTETAFGQAEIILEPSAYDPWTEIEIVRVLGAMYTRGNNSMVGAKVVAEVEPMAFAPFAFLRWDLK